MQLDLKLAAKLVSVLLFGYLALRSALVPFTFDEVQTFIYYIQPGEFMPYDSRVDANNHVINSALAWLSSKVFGKSLLALRLPNLLAFSVLVYFIFRSRRMFESTLPWFMFFISIVCCHFLLDFFNLCRGYGLSMAFFLGALFHFLEFEKSKQSANLLYGGLLLCACLWSNLALLICASAMLGVGGIGVIRKLMDERQLVSVAPGFLILGITTIGVAFAANYATSLKEAGALYFGGEDGFWESTVKVLFVQVSESHSWGEPFKFVCMILYLIAALWTFVSKRFKATTMAVFAILWLTVLGTIVLNLAMDVKFPLDRSALQFIILFCFSLFLLVDSAPKWMRYVSGVIPLVLVAHFFSTANLSHSTRWKSQVVPREFYDHLAVWTAENSRVPTIALNLYQAYNLSFQDGLGNACLFPYVNPTLPSRYSDFVLYTPRMEDPDEVYDITAPYDTALFSPAVPTVLLKRRTAPVESLVEAVTIQPFSGEGDYLNLADLIVDTTQQFQAFRIDIEVDLQAHQVPADLILVTRLSNENGIIGKYRSNIKITQADFREGKKIRTAHLIESKVSEITDIKVFLVNSRKVDVEILDGEVTMHGISEGK